MKKIGLLALISIFGITALSFNSKSPHIVNNNPKIVEKRCAKSTGGELSTILPAFDITSKNIDYHDINGVEANAFVLSDNIIEENATSEIKYENFVFNFAIEGVKLEDLQFEDDENCLKIIKAEDKGEKGYSVTFEVINAPKDKMTVLSISDKNNSEVSLKVNVHFVDAYFNIYDKYVIKPLYINDKTHKFDITITDGSEISGIKGSSELDIKEVSNKNDKNEQIVKTSFNLNQLQYTFETKNLGTAIYQINFQRDLLPNYSPIIRSANIYLKIIESNDYYFFELNDEDNLTQIETSTENRKVFEANQLYTFYIGNNSPDFDPRDYELKKKSDLGAFDAVELRNDMSLGMPFLKVVLITGDESRQGNLNFGFIGDKVNSKSLYFTINEPTYTIKFNSEKITSPYYVHENINFNAIENLLEVYQGTKKIDIIPEFSEIKRIIGKQRIYIDFKKIGKTICFDIDITLNPKEREQDSEASTSQMATYYKIFLEKLAFDIPVEYENAEEAYEYAKNEYKFLNAQAKKDLIDDYSFIKTYRKFITQNDFKDSFFEGIIVRLDNSRYIVPTVTLFAFVIVFGIILGVSLHTIYNKKGDDNKDE